MITKEAIKSWIKNHAAAEFEPDRIDYYLHITDEGEVVDDYSKADKSFICSLRPEDFGLTWEEYETAENPEAIYQHEVDGDPIFEKIIDNLMSQALNYLQ